MPYFRDDFFDNDPWVRISFAFGIASPGPVFLDIPPTGAKNYGVNAFIEEANGFVTMAMNLTGGIVTQTGLDDIYDGPHSLTGLGGNGQAQMVMDDHQSPFPDELEFIRVAIGRTGGGPITYSYELFAEVPGPGSGGSVNVTDGVGCERPPWPYSVELGGSEGDWGAVRFKTLH